MGQNFKILSYNIHRGRHYFTRKDVVRKVIDIMRSAEADVICLQEVWRDSKETLHQLEALCRDDWKFQAFSPACIFPNGAQGNLILSRWDILDWTEADLSIPGAQTRSLVHATLRVPGQDRRVSVICLHLGLLRREREVQLDKLTKYLGDQVPSKEPLVVAGDFNDWREEATDLLAGRLNLEEAYFKIRGHHARTYPALFPILRLDRIYFKNCGLGEASLLRNRFYVEPSDHVPLWARFSIE